VHEEVSVDVVVLHWQAGGHEAGMGSARALVGARGAIFQDVLADFRGPGLTILGVQLGVGYILGVIRGRIDPS
jgi:hypothetical protein